MTAAPGAEVRRPGLQSTVQDAGRRVRALGIPAGGAADPTARRLANALVGNAPGDAGLEVTLHGPALHFRQAALVSLCGAPFTATLDGHPFPLWRAVPVQAGQVLDIGGTTRGSRAFLAVRGGLRGQAVYGSVSTDLRGAFGGLEGRAVRRGDTLRWAARPAVTPPRAFVGAALHTPTGPHHALRVQVTPEGAPDRLPPLTGRTFRVGAQADRMGARLGPAVPATHDPARVSLPNVPGQVQLPPDGHLILLLPDAGTHGGYPAPLVVASVDWPRLGQLRPGDTVTFHPRPTAELSAALRAAEREIRQAETALQAWYAAQ